MEVNTFNLDNEETIIKINCKCYWNWDIHNDKCPICRNFIFEPSLNEDSSNSNSNSKKNNGPVIGVCGHAFHADCIANWTKTRNVCPLCNKQWQFLTEDKVN